LSALPDAKNVAVAAGCRHAFVFAKGGRLRGENGTRASPSRLRKLIERHVPAGKKQLPILSGEWGYAAHAKGVSRDTQAAYLVCMQLANLLDGVRVSIWYDWKDDGADPNEREHNFGTVTQDRPSPPCT
jgi:hypothetical protein